MPQAEAPTEPTGETALTRSGLYMSVIDSTLGPLQERRGWHGDKDLSRDGCGRLQGYAEHNAFLLQIKSSQVIKPVSFLITCLFMFNLSSRGSAVKMKTADFRTKIVCRYSEREKPPKTDNIINTPYNVNKTNSHKLNSQVIKPVSF